MTKFELHKHRNRVYAVPIKRKFFGLIEYPDFKKAKPVNLHNHLL